MKVVQEKVVTVDGHLGIKRYLMLEKLGEGSYSQCFKVQVSGTDQFYAMKVIPKAKLKETQRQKLLEQIRIHQSLSHQHIVFLDHWFQDSVNHYILLQYCPNRTLEQRCAKFSTMEEKHVRKYGSQLLSALKYLHSQKVMHRDLKLTNSFLSAEDEVKLGDFGLACRLQSSTDLKREPCGTPDFAAPELIGGFGYSFPADVWSFGVVLYRMKFGHCPFDKIKVEDTLRKVKLADYQFPPWVSISPELTDLISKILVIDYDERLTLSEVQQHPFFKAQIPRVGSFRALVNKLFTPDSKSKDKRRIDSCQTRKDIKKILKQRVQATTILTPKKRTQICQDSLDQNNNTYFDNSKTFGNKSNKEQLTKIQFPKYDSSKEQSTVAGSKESNTVEPQSNKQLPKLYLLDQSQVIVINMPQTAPKPEINFQNPSNRIARMTHKFKQQNIAESILTYYSSYLVYQLEEYCDYFTVYLTNGLRQIFRQGQIYFIVGQGYYLDILGQRVESPPKIIDYICKQKLKDSKFKLTEQTIKSIIQKGNYISKWKKIEDNRLLVTLTQGTVLASPNSKVFYLKTTYNDYLYNDRLEIISGEKQIVKFRLIGQRSAKSRDKSATRHRKLLE